MSHASNCFRLAKLFFFVISSQFFIKICWKFSFKINLISDMQLWDFFDNNSQNRNFAFNLKDYIYFNIQFQISTDLWSLTKNFLK